MVLRRPVDIVHVSLPHSPHQFALEIPVSVAFSQRLQLVERGILAHPVIIPVHEQDRLHEQLRYRHAAQRIDRIQFVGGDLLFHLPALDDHQPDRRSQCRPEETEDYPPHGKLTVPRQPAPSPYDSNGIESYDYRQEPTYQEEERAEHSQEEGKHREDRSPPDSRAALHRREIRLCRDKGTRTRPQAAPGTEHPVRAELRSTALANRSLLAHHVPVPALCGIRGRPYHR